MASCLLIDRDAASRGQIRELLSELGLRCAEHEDWPATLAFPHNRYDFVFFGNPDPEACAALLKTHHGSSRQIVFCYFADHPNVDVISSLVVAGASDVIMLPADRALLALKLSQAGLRTLRDAA
jgi:DNA-binding NtrC family response regulator